MVNHHATSLAILAGQGDPTSRSFELGAGVIHGTAFGLAPGLFLTAGHVFGAAQADGDVAVGRLTPGRTHVLRVQDAEVFPDIDLAILHCPDLQADLLPFHFGPLDFLVDVAAVGFPFGLELSIGPERQHVYHLRAFKGHVVTRRGLTDLPGAPPGYELSFVPPPGLSGAPLLVWVDDVPAITGMIQKHHTAEIGDRRMELGLALDAEELLTLESRIVGGSLAEAIFGRPRLPPRNHRP